MSERNRKIWLVAVDGSHFAENAFHACLDRMDPKNDVLFLQSVVEVHSAIVQELMPGAETKRKDMTNMYVKILKDYTESARLLGIEKINSIVSVSTHVGEMICEAAKKHDADIIVVGTKGLGALESLIFGSTTRYVVENATCDVLVIKKPSFPAELHDNKKTAILSEEAERVRRVNEYIEAREQDKKDRKVAKMGTFVDEEMERRARGKSEATDVQHISKSYAIMHEELERNRRMEEMSDAKKELPGHKEVRLREAGF